MQDLSPIRQTQAERQDALPLALPDTGFVRQNLLLRFVPFSKSTLWRRVKARTFPAPVQLSTGITAWRVEDVRRWIAQPESSEVRW
jgi:predicted DNA-binding transcriptional regulator AlpA